MISLNIKSITDEIFALTALRAAIGAPTDTFPPVLTRDHLPALRVVVRSVFASLVTRLHEYITDSSVEEANIVAERPYDDRQPVTLGIDFGANASTLSAGSLMVLKRYLEHLLALMTLEKVYLPIDTAISADLASRATSLLASVTSMLADPGFPESIVAAYI